MSFVLFCFCFKLLLLEVCLSWRQLSSGDNYCLINISIPQSKNGTAEWLSRKLWDLTPKHVSRLSVCIPGIGPEVIAVFHAEKEVTPLGIAEWNRETRGPECSRKIFCQLVLVTTPPRSSGITGWHPSSASTMGHGAQTQPSPASQQWLVFPQKLTESRSTQSRFPSKNSVKCLCEVVRIGRQSSGDKKMW